ncbi:mastermind-like protein 2 [Heteronotia binoei]|uniref:mastermind-like protein 2 n=1 Tax=Heteronotia binoei TaxID=13085 RepID=UPI00292D37B8|nr:mastermind-like protein 2 [Heteronotia binoei]
MGDTAPPQAPAALLGGGGGGGAAAAAGPRVHSAIVERLRARIAVCRQHHLNCEGRYERGRAESSDRERESTLQLLHLVQHGQAARKGGKHAKAAGAAAAAAGNNSNSGGASAAASNATAPPPADYYQQQLLSNGTAGGGSGINGGQHSATAAGEQRNPALLALQGSLKRKLVVNLSPAINKRSNGIADSTFLDIKRVRVGDNNLSAAQSGHCGNNCPNQSLLGNLTVGQSSQRKVNSPTSNAQANANGMFNMALKEVKKEPGETFSCSKHLDGQPSQGNTFPNRYGEDTGEQLMDPELQELFNELTNISVPPMSDLELENMINATIKQDEPFNIDIGQQVQRAPSARSSSLQMDKIVIKQEYSPVMNQGSVGSPQMRPSSTGPAFTMSSSALSASSPIPSTPQTQTPPSQMSSVSNRPMPSWQEVSHAQQLKQIAANRQQHALIQQSQPSTWPTLPSAESSPGPFVQEKMPNSSFHQQQFSSQSSGMPGIPVNGNQSKGMNSYIYRTTSMPQGSSINIVMQRKAQDLNRGYISNAQLPLEESQNSVKPLFHFNSEQVNQQMPSVLGAQNKPTILHYTQQAAQQQQPNSAAVQPQTQQQQQQPLQTQQQQQPSQALQSQPLQRPPNIPLALQQKIMLQKMLKSQPVAGMQYPVPSQHQLDQHSVIGQSAEPSPGSGTCSNANTGSSFMNSPQQALLNQQLKQQLLLQHQQQQQQQQQQILTEAEKITPQDQLNRHLTRPPPDYKDQRRNQVNIQQTHQYSGGAPAMNISASMCFPSPISTPSISQQASTLLAAAHGSRMPSHPATRHVGCYGTIPCSQPSVYTVTTSGASQVPQHRNPNQIIPNPNSSATSRQALPGQGNNLSAFESSSGVNSQAGKLSFNPGTSGQRPLNVMVTTSSAIQNWIAQETGGKPQDTQKVLGSPFPVGSPYPNQPLQRAVAHQQFLQRATVPPNPLGAVQMRTPVNHSLNGQMVGSQKAPSARSTQVRAQAMPHLNPPAANVTPPSPLLSTHFPTSTNQTTARVFQGSDPANDLAFDFLSQQGDSIGPALNSDSDFIDSLLKTEPGNDDWMKDINLDEILGGHS